MVADSGLEIIWETVIAFFSAIVGDDGLGRLYDDFIVGTFDAFIGGIFSTLSVDLAFSLIMALIIFALFYRYIYSAVV